MFAENSELTLDTRGLRADLPPVNQADLISLINAAAKGPERLTELSFPSLGIEGFRSVPVAPHAPAAGQTSLSELVKPRCGVVRPRRRSESRRSGPQKVPSSLQAARLRAV